MREVKPPDIETIVSEVEITAYLKAEKLLRECYHNVTDENLKLRIAQLLPSLRHD